MEITLESIGLTNEQLQKLVVEHIAEQAIAGDDSLLDQVWDAARKTVEKVIKEKVDDIATKHIAPKVQELIDGATLNETNNWGEAKGEPLTFTEYLTGRAEKYMQEPVDCSGKSSGSFVGRKDHTRLLYLIDQHLQVEISTALKSAALVVNKQLGTALAETVKLQMQQIIERLKVEVVTGR